ICPLGRKLARSNPNEWSRCSHCASLTSVLRPGSDSSNGVTDRQTTRSIHEVAIMVSGCLTTLNFSPYVAWHRTASANHAVELMSREPKIHIGKWTPKNRPDTE